MKDVDALAPYRARADLCKVLTEPKRLMLLDALRGGERSVGELADAIGASLPNVSQHLAVMRNAGLVDASRAGTSVRYRLAEPTITDACAIVDAIVRRRLGQAPARPGDPRRTSHFAAPPTSSLRS